AKHDEEIGRDGGLVRALHLNFWHRLPERDGRGLNHAATARAKRKSLIDSENLPHPIELVTLPTIKTGCIRRVTVQLDNLVVGHAGGLVQTVNVLRDNGQHSALLDKTGERTMAGVRCCLFNHLAAGKFAAPSFPAGFRRSEKIAELDRPE